MLARDYTTLRKDLTALLRQYAASRGRMCENEVIDIFITRAGECFGVDWLATRHTPARGVAMLDQAYTETKTLANLMYASMCEAAGKARQRTIAKAKATRRAARRALVISARR